MFQLGVEKNPCKGAKCKFVPVAGVWRVREWRLERGRVQATQAEKRRFRGFRFLLCERSNDGQHLKVCAGAVSKWTVRTYRHSAPELRQERKLEQAERRGQKPRERGRQRSRERGTEMGTGTQRGGKRSREARGRHQRER